jgi:phage I-like protein
MTPAHRAVAAVLDLKTLAESPRSPVTVTRAGQFHDPRYGDFEITRQMLSEMVLNFNAKTYGQAIFVDVAHNPDQGAAGTMTKLWVDGDKLLASVEWTPYGLTAIKERGYQYLSAEYHDNWTDNEKRQPHGALLIGAALTIRPAIKRLDPIQLSEPVALHRDLQNQFTREVHHQMKAHLLALQKALAEAKLTQPVIDQLGEAFSAAAKTLGEDDKALADLAQRMIDTGKKLAETLGEKPAVIHLTVPPPSAPEKTDAKTLSEADVKRLLAEDRAALEAHNKTLAESLATRQKQFADLLAADEGLKALSEPVKKLLHDAVALVRADSTPEQIKALAEQQIALGHQIGVSAQLARLGYQGQMVGSTRITLGDDASPLKLQEHINGKLKDSLSHGNGRLRLKDDKDLKPAVKRILAEFDRANGQALYEETKRLADGGATTVSNLNVPVGFQRTVIREALSDLNILNLVQVLTDPQAQATTQIPYELRKAGTLLNDGVVYEAAGIPRASVEQKMDTAYINKMALSVRITNEVAHFSRSSLIDWDAYARNVDSNARVMRELVARRIANELQRSADAYLPTTRTAESVTAQLDGSKSLLKTTYWPIVRPKQHRDLQGSAIGSAINPISVVINTVARSEYDGTGTQAAGIYWVLENANLGYIRLVTEAGVATGPANTGTNTVTYASANNVVKFDLKLPASTTLEDHLNGALRAVGARKAMMSADRYIMPDMMLMSPVLNDTLTNAAQFAAEMMRAGSALGGAGDLVTVKGIPAFATNAPGIDLGDERIIMGERGTLSYVVAKAFMTGMPFEAVNGSGLPTGERIAYGEEFNAIHVPSPIQNRLTSLVMYDSDARTAAT